MLNNSDGHLCMEVSDLADYWNRGMEEVRSLEKQTLSQIYDIADKKSVLTQIPAQASSW